MNGERYILGIESSCDETAAALVTREGRIGANLVASQVDMHARFGGVVPEVAARMHIQACLPLVEGALAEAGATWEQVEAIAVTQGPGLIGCLLVGLETAKALAWQRALPLIGVNHLAGHLHAIFLTPPAGAHRLMEAGEEILALPLARDGEGDAARVTRPEFPHVGLIVSGGHTSLVVVEAPGRARTIAQTRDDAVGEAYDKVARLLGLGYPGGPVIDRLATEGDAQAFDLPIPMMRGDRPDFSFSGLKTAVAREVERLNAEQGGAPDEQTVRDICASFQRVAVEALLGKALAAAEAHGARDLVVTGGVACNRGLRRRARELSERRAGLRAWFPNPSLCTDNAAMIAGVAWHLAPLERGEALALNARASMPIGGE